MITNYKQTKEEVLKLYSEFTKLCNEIEFDNNGSDVLMITLKKQAEHIRQDKFMLMIAGEAKSGKSTFINAYLGENILPMDIKQCTSSIVEISYGETFTLIATYADGRQKYLKDENLIKKFLKDNAALNDEYRDIPIPTINNEVLIKYKGKIGEQVIKDLIKGVQTENIHNLPLNEYEKKIREYIRAHKDTWKNIVVKMEIAYPIKDESLRGIEIIDSPGVNADGRVGDVTESYIKNADAVMFLKPITGQALESTSFKRFMKSKSMDRNKNALFLILTRAANETIENRDRILHEALKQFKGVEEEHIILVDSKVEMFIKLINDKSIEEIEKILMDLGSKNQLEDFILAPWFTSQKNKEVFIQALREKSNFMNVEAILNRFGRRSHYIALSQFLERMLKVFIKIQDNFKANIKLYETKAKDPIELGRQIARIKTQLSEIQLKMNESVEDIVKKYTVTNGVVTSKVTERVDCLKKDITDIQNEDLEELEKVALRKVDELGEFKIEIEKNLVAECNEALITLSDSSEIPYTSLEPDFTIDTFKTIVEKTKSSANENEYYTTGKTFKKTETRSAYSSSKHFKLVKDSIIDRLDKIKNDVIRDLNTFVIDTSNIYIDELARNAQEKKDELTKIAKEKKNAEEIQETILELRSFVKRIEPNKEMITEIKGGIDSYV
ncbi:dynamin family protein [Bacillus sp. CGMCC 1.16541]|uniref:dynamin family protein n=1 Tax=Bacillus sp. CGMCC 1.16541 TaxID=2185143 RepID=UPI000D727BB8|nr:dynamin family protein [Bacillus sp. CGMCC 1.16541]